MAFRKAERKKAFLKIAITGPSGAGKTYSALQLARGMGEKIAMLDTENGSGELYSTLCDYDVEEISAPFTVDKYVKSIKEAEASGYDVLIIDSLTHAWAGEGGLLEKSQEIARTKYRGNSYAAWNDVSKMHNQLTQAILQSKIHIIATMRSKQDYVQTEDKKVKKVGMGVQQREGMEYEFTIVFDIDREKHEATTSKDRTNMFDEFIGVITPNVGKRIIEWANSGEAVQPKSNEADDLGVKLDNNGMIPQTKPIEDNYVTIAGDECFIALKRDNMVQKINIKNASQNELNFCVNHELYKLARPYIQKLLESKQ